MMTIPVVAVALIIIVAAMNIVMNISIAICIIDSIVDPVRTIDIHIFSYCQYHHKLLAYCWRLDSSVSHRISCLDTYGAWGGSLLHGFPDSGRQTSILQPKAPNRHSLRVWKVFQTGGAPTSPMKTGCITN